LALHYVEMGMLSSLACFIGSITWHAKRHSEAWVQGRYFNQRDSPKVFRFLYAVYWFLLLAIFTALIIAIFRIFMPISR